VSIASGPVTPERRLLFWLRISFVADAVFLAVAVALVAAGEVAGWYLGAFTLVRAVLGAVTLFWIAPHVLA
jgi:hypothetical protein